MLARVTGSAQGRDSRFSTRDSRPSTLPGSVSIDCDTLSDYARGYGFEYPADKSVYVRGLARFLDLFRARGIRATLFVIGRDLESPAVRRVLLRALDEGHELANHTWSHPRQLGRLSVEERREEIIRTHEAARRWFGVAMQGFRAPCYDIDRTTCAILHELGYRYDSSVHPSPLVPLFDVVVLVKSLGRSREFRKNCWRGAFAARRPFRVRGSGFGVQRKSRDESRQTGARREQGAADSPAGTASQLSRLDSRRSTLLEVPLSVWSAARRPFYGTWTLVRGMRQLHRGLAWLAKRRLLLNYHFHAVELMGLAEDGIDHRFAGHPGMKLPLAAKRSLIEETLDAFCGCYRLVPLAKLAAGQNERDRVS